MQVYNDLCLIGADRVRVRFSGPELEDGTIPVEEYARIARKTRDLVLAAACSATDARSFWPQRKPSAAAEHVRCVRIGQSEQGSYVVTIISRVAPQLHSGNSLSCSEEEPPFERRVTETLARSLHALDEATEQAVLLQEMEPFYKAVSEGVSANLCDAVAGLTGESDIRRSLDFSFSWSPVRPVAAELERRVSFSSDRIPFIREAARHLRDREPVPEFDLAGPVVKLERPEGAEAGRVTVMGFVEERPVRIALELRDASYRSAVSAHGEGLTVRTTGTLAREGRGYVLKNPTDIVVEREPEG